MYLDRLRLPPPKGVLPHIEVVDELYFSLKSSKKGHEARNFSKKQHILHQQLKNMKQLKQLARLKYNYNSSQTAEFHPLHRVSRDHSTFQP